MEELDLQSLLDRFRVDGFERGEKVILGHFGTVQSLLTIIFDMPIRVQLVNQAEHYATGEKGGEIIRVSQLMAGECVVCHAVSHIPLERNIPEVIYDITAGSLGLGQIVVKHQIPNSRNILDLGRNKVSFWRYYEIVGPRLYINIHEHFLRKPFEDVGWLEPEMKPNLNYKSQGGKDAK